MKIREFLNDKLLLILTAFGCLIILVFLGSVLLGYNYRVKWTVSVSGEDFSVNNEVEVMNSDGSYNKTIKSLKTADKICFFGHGPKYVFTIIGQGKEFHPEIEYEEIRFMHREINYDFFIYQNGERWDATVTSGGKKWQFQNIEKNGIHIVENGV